MKSCRIYLIRHGETIANRQGIVQGHRDYPLTQEGKSEIIKLSKSLTKVNFAAVFSSDLKRSKETAKILISDLDRKIKTTNLLRERTYGRYEGKKIEVYRSELKALLLKRAGLGKKERFSYKLRADIESDQEVVSRILTFINKVVTLYLGKNILVVTHSSVIRVLLIYLGFVKYQEFTQKKINNLDLFILESDGINFSLLKDYIISN